MKIIELLNMISKGEEVPKEIEYQGTRYIFDENDYKLYKGASLLTKDCLTSYINAIMLNDEIEIIEEKPKEIEFLGKQDLYIDDARGYSVNVEKIGDKVNELIRKVNYLLEKESDK